MATPTEEGVSLSSKLVSGSNQSSLGRRVCAVVSFVPVTEITQLAKIKGMPWPTHICVGV